MRTAPRRLRRFFHSLFTRVLLIGATVVLLGTVNRSLLLSGILVHDTEVSASAGQLAFASHVAHDLDQKIALRQETLRRLARALPPQLLDAPPKAARLAARTPRAAAALFVGPLRRASRRPPDRQRTA